VEQHAGEVAPARVPAQLDEPRAEHDAEEKPAGRPQRHARRRAARVERVRRQNLSAGGRVRLRAAAPGGRRAGRGGTHRTRAHGEEAGLEQLGLPPEGEPPGARAVSGRVGLGVQRRAARGGAPDVCPSETKEW